jgi:undecaprenyl-diphosphatase
LVIRRGLVLGTWIVVICLVGLTAAHFRYNFHIVRPGQLYRCGQLPSDHWNSVLKHYGIRTVINLRGQLPDRDWYQAEKQAAERYGVLHLDLALSRHNLPDPDVVEQLFDWHTSVPRPVLIHCQAGADRTCMVVVLWLLLEDDATVSEARAQTGLWFGQLPWRNGARQLQRLLDDYESWLEQHQCSHSSAQFRHWVRQYYSSLVHMGHYERTPMPIIPLVED